MAMMIGSRTWSAVMWIGVRVWGVGSVAESRVACGAGAPALSLSPHRDERECPQTAATPSRMCSPARALTLGAARMWQRQSARGGEAARRYKTCIFSFGEVAVTIPTCSRRHTPGHFPRRSRSCGLSIASARPRPGGCAQPEVTQRRDAKHTVPRDDRVDVIGSSGRSPDHRGHASYASIFPTGNRNAASHRWASWILSRSGELSADSLATLFTGFCPVSGSPVSPTSFNTYHYSLPLASPGKASASCTTAVRLACATPMT